MIRSSFSILFFIRDSKVNKEGKAPIEVKITVNGNKCNFSTGKQVNPEKWDECHYFESSSNQSEYRTGKEYTSKIIIDKLPTLNLHKIEHLFATVRSNKVSIALRFQELPLLKPNYDKVRMQKVITTVGNVVSESERAKKHPRVF